MGLYVTSFKVKKPGYKIKYYLLMAPASERIDEVAGPAFDQLAYSAEEQF